MAGSKKSPSKNPRKKVGKTLDLQAGKTRGVHKNLLAGAAKRLSRCPRKSLVGRRKNGQAEKVGLLIHRIPTKNQSDARKNHGHGSPSKKLKSRA